MEILNGKLTSETIKKRAGYPGKGAQGQRTEDPAPGQRSGRMTAVDLVCEFQGESLRGNRFESTLIRYDDSVSEEVLLTR